MPSYTYPLDFNCEGITVLKDTICFPVRVDCEPTPEDGIYSQPGQEFNKNLCPGDSCYYMPFQKGDKIQFQTLFIDPMRDDPTTYDALITVLLLNPNGELISSNISEFATRKISGWTGSYNYQILEVDTSLIDEDCFKLSFTSGETELVTQDFQLERNCSTTLLIRSTYPKSDCNKFWYAEPEEFTGDNFTYDNSLRYYAWIKPDGDTISKERFGTKGTSARSENFYTLFMAGLVPYYVKSLLVNTHLAGDRIWIDNAEYNFDDVAIDVNRNSGNMISFDVRGSRKCFINYNC
jgi:hypothetical protein